MLPIVEEDGEQNRGSRIDNLYIYVFYLYRVKKIAAQQEKQYELLKLIVQKMEIQTEADEQDEGDANPFMGKNG